MLKKVLESKEINFYIETIMLTIIYCSDYIYLLFGNKLSRGIISFK